MLLPPCAVVIVVVPLLLLDKLHTRLFMHWARRMRSAYARCASICRCQCVCVCWF